MPPRSVAGQPTAGAADQLEPDDPHDDDEDRAGGEASPDQGVGELAAGNDDEQDGDDQGGFEDEGEAAGHVGEGFAAADPERVEGDEDDGLDSDAAKQVADGDLDIPRDRGADGDGDLGQVGGDGEQDDPAECGAEVEAFGQHVGVLRQRDARHPDHRRRGQEDREQDEGGQGRHGVLLGVEGSVRWRRGLSR